MNILITFTYLSHLLFFFNLVLAGLKRCGKSCRLRWINYLKPDIKRGNITVDEEELIIRLHKLLGNRQLLFLALKINLKLKFMVGIFVLFFEQFA